MTDSRPAATLDKVILRLPDGLRDRLNELARVNGRSANAEAVQALQAWLFPQNRGTPTFFALPDELLDMISRAAKRSHRSTHEEIVARLTDTFDEEPSESSPEAGLDIRSEIRSAMYEAVEDLLADTDLMKRLGYTLPKPEDRDNPVIE